MLAGSCGPGSGSSFQAVVGGRSTGVSVDDAGACGVAAPANERLSKLTDVPRAPMAAKARPARAP